MHVRSVTSASLNLYFLLVYLVAVGITSSFLPDTVGTAATVKIFSLAEVLAYSVFYLLPGLILSGLVSFATLAARKPARWKDRLVLAVACASGTLTILFLAADRYLFSLYHYHFNGFVWNLIITPGGIDSLGATAATKAWLAVAVSTILALNAGALWLLLRRWDTGRFDRQIKYAVYSAITLLAVTFAAGEGQYAYARFTNDGPLLKVASAIPLHLDTTATTLFKKLGVQRPEIQERIRMAQGKVNYPLGPLKVEPVKKPLNIVWLTSESFRWDLLDPEITPNLWKFSQRAIKFNQHYSGGNRTRMGMFSMFYGLYAPYWYGFQQQKIPPQIMRLIAGSNYQMQINTSQSFTYPELNDTVFTGIPKSDMQELKEGPPWQRDVENISSIQRFIQMRDPLRPFFTFMFFESTHAPYDFPESAIIRKDYLEDVNYLNLNSFTADTRRLHNRYVNAAHHIDAQVGRTLDLLEQEKLFDDTLVLFTGDHGEEFMENGHWGHGHNEVFPEQQIRVPLVLWIPGIQPRQIDYPTSHNQLPATLLPLLGVTSGFQGYASEDSLFTSVRPYRVVGSYDYLGLVDQRGKLSFPYTTADYFHYIVSDGADHLVPVRDQQKLIDEKQGFLNEVETECRRFVAEKSRFLISLN